MTRNNKIFLALGVFTVFTYLFNKRGVITQAKNIIKENEGFKLNAYKDSTGTPTIGYGSTNYTLVPSLVAKFGRHNVKMGDKITAQEAEQLLDANIDFLGSKISGSLKRLNSRPNELGALISFAYNMGLTGLLNSSLWKLYNVNTPLGEVAKQFEKYVFSKGQRIQGLVNRRKKEKALFIA